MGRSVLWWRRIGLEGLERLELDVGSDRIAAHGSLLSLEGGGICVDHRWLLDNHWRAQLVEVGCRSPQGQWSLRLERAGNGWIVDGVLRPDLDGADEPDLSVTPFCNTLPVRRLGPAAGAELTLDTAYIDGVTLAVTRSRQRYARVGQNRVHYVDLGVANGFEADLEVDREGLVLRYEHLFERIIPAG